MSERIPAWVDGRLTLVDKIAAHRLGLRHKAVSVFLVDGDRTLLQRRAPSKYHSGGLWTNTCCTHPRWGETNSDCARRRLGEELGLMSVALERRGTVEYRAEVGPDMTEHELVEVFVGDLGADALLAPDPSEVAELRWTGLAALEAEIAAVPERFTAWLRIYLRDHAEMILGTTATA
jgi:isopentenyl-diphosphate Delta-isomerase